MFICAVYDNGTMKSYICEDIAQNTKYKCISEKKLSNLCFVLLKILKNYLIELRHTDGKLKVLSLKHTTH